MNIFYSKRYTIPLQLVREALYIPCDPNAANSILEVRIGLVTGHRISLVAEEASDFWRLWTADVLLERASGRVEAIANKQGVQKCN